VSAVTVRADLTALEARARVRRVRGGAVPPSGLLGERPFESSQWEAPLQKSSIGVHAAGMIATGDTVILDVGTTTTAIARALVLRTELHDVTVDLTQPILCVLDGAKALHRAVLDILDHPVIARCQLHQLRDVRDKLPERLRGPVQRRMRAADPAPPPWTPRRSWPRWPASWTGPIPARRRACVRAQGDPHGAAAGGPTDPGGTLRATNAIQSMLSSCREHAGNARALAGRHDGAGLVRSRDGPGRQAVPPRQRSPVPARPRRRAPGRGCWSCHRSMRGSGGGSGLNIMGPPPKLDGTRDILATPVRAPTSSRPATYTIRWDATPS
jgi:hypothetical protein